MRHSSPTPLILPMRRAIDFLSSFTLATALLALLLVLTFLGTLEQAEHGLVASQARYFESLFVDRVDVGACWRALALDVYWNFGQLSIPTPFLPGGYTVMALLFVNMFLGGLIRIRKKPHTVGVVISHFAILFMIASGAVTYHFAKEGILNLAEGQTSDEFQSFHERVIEIEKLVPEGQPRKALVIDGAKFRDLGNAADHGKARSFFHKDLPFELVVSNWKEHAEVRRAQEDHGDAVGGFYLQELSKFDQRGQLLADEALSQACVAEVRPKESGKGEMQRGLLWEFSAAPWTVKWGEDTYLIHLTRRTHKLPFAIRLDETAQEKHPGTDRARRFYSKVTQISGKQEQKRLVTMNEPVRSQGYALFQSTFDDGSQSGAKVKRSGFQVVENPSDHWPLISCIIVAAGLLIHFVMMLARAMRWPVVATTVAVLLLVGGGFALAYYKL